MQSPAHAAASDSSAPGIGRASQVVRGSRALELPLYATLAALAALEPSRLLYYHCILHYWLHCSPHTYCTTTTTVLSVTVTVLYWLHLLEPLAYRYWNYHYWV
jgi:hypothetical protein